MNRREIYEFKCCNEGRLVSKENINGKIICKNQDGHDTQGRMTHFFLILSPNDYCNSPGSQYISVLPITSSKGSYVQMMGFTIANEDLEFGYDIIGDNILFDRPLRIFKGYILGNCKGMIQYKSYEKIMSKMIHNFGTDGILNDTFKKIGSGLQK